MARPAGGAPLPGVRRVAPTEVGEVAGVLARAFDGNPPTRWVLPEGGDRVRRLEPFFRAVLRHVYLPHGRPTVTADGQGVALWMPPGGWPPPARAVLGLLPAALRAHRRHPVRALRADRAISTGQPRETGWYLEYLGVDPEAQGGGRGSALIEVMTRECDDRGLASSLEAGSERARDLYARHGFETTAAFELPGGGPPMWRMWRPPRLGRGGREAASAH